MKVQQVFPFYREGVTLAQIAELVKFTLPIYERAVWLDVEPVQPEDYQTSCREDLFRPNRYSAFERKPPFGWFNDPWSRCNFNPLYYYEDDK